MIDALADSSIRFVTTRDERGAAFMADTYGALTGRPGVCLATLGPGAINLMLGIANAQLDSHPLVGDHRAGEPRPHLQGIAPVRRPRLAVPADHEVGRHGHGAAIAAPEMVRKAFKQATHRAPGRDLPRRARRRRGAEDRRAALRVNTPGRSRAGRGPGASSRPRARRAREHPVVLAGPGVARDGATEALVRFSERLNLPVATTFLGKGVFPDNHPERARHDRLHGEGLRQLRVRPSGRGRGRGLRPGRVLAVAVEPDGRQADRPRPPHGRRGRCRLHAGGRGTGQHRRDARRDRRRRASIHDDPRTRSSPCET